MMLTISSAEIIRNLAFDNPWWAGGVDAMPPTFERRRFYFEGFKELALNWDVRRSVILMGPRRVGKTVLLQQFIQDLLEEGFDPKAVFFASVDTPVYSGLRLDELVSLFETHTELVGDEKRIVIFDEIQYLKDWEVGLKVLTDRYPNTRFIASGSAAAALKLKSQESGAGRFTDFILPPLTFAEFLLFRDRSGLMAADEERKHVSTDIYALNEEFQAYLNFGGYPEAVLSPEIQKDVKRYLGRDIIDKVLLRDLPTLYGIQDVQELNRLFTTLAYNSGQEVSLEKLSNTSGVAKNTVKKYLEYLEAAFLIMILKRVDQHGKSFKRMVNFKVYLTNPSMRSALFGPLEADDEAMGWMVETAIFSQWFHSLNRSNLFYARWKKGKTDHEVDLVYVDVDGKPNWAIEIKWSDRYLERPGELRGLCEFARNNEMQSKFFRRPFTSTTRTKVARKVQLVGNNMVEFRPSAEYCYIVGLNTAKHASKKQADISE